MSSAKEDKAPAGSPFDSGYWTKRYTKNETGWDIGYVSTPLKEYFDQLKDKNISILIPGCGNAYEAEYLFSKGFKNVFLLDISPAPLNNFSERAPGFPSAHLLCEDFFSHNGQYSLVVEQTFFCALHPSERKRYAEKIHALLKPGGKMAGVLFDCEFEKKGPPFGGNKEEYKTCFVPLFDLKVFETAYNSISPRAGRELFILAVQK